MDLPSGIVFIIDTDQYAGSFEREMCALMTGMIGDCDAGEEEAQQYQDDVACIVAEGQVPPDLNRLPIRVPDLDNGCMRPVTIWKAPKGEALTSVGIFMCREPTMEELEFLMGRARAFASSYGTDNHKLNILGFRTVTLAITETVLWRGGV